MTQKRMKVKYPRTPHLPWSPGNTSDDVLLINTEHLEAQQVIVTEKMDGECSSLYKDYFHARSIDGNSHPSQSWLKQFHAGIKHDIPDGWRICGENLYAKHSIHYDNLESYFLGFSIWDRHNACLSWEETLEWFDILDIASPPILYSGIWNEKIIKSIKLDLHKQEGYVIRLASSFPYSRFGQSVAKWVRANHVQTDDHWAHQSITINKLQ